MTIKFCRPFIVTKVSSEYNTHLDRIGVVRKIYIPDKFDGCLVFWLNTKNKVCENIENFNKMGAAIEYLDDRYLRIMVTKQTKEDVGKKHPITGKLFRVTKGDVAGCIGSVFDVSFIGIKEKVILWFENFEYDRVDSFLNPHYIKEWSYLNKGETLCFRIPSEFSE